MTYRLMIRLYLHLTQLDNCVNHWKQSGYTACFALINIEFNASIRFGRIVSCNRQFYQGRGPVQTFGIIVLIHAQKTILGRAARLDELFETEDYESIQASLVLCKCKVFYIYAEERSPAQVARVSTNQAHFLCRYVQTFSAVAFFNTLA
jgi:hypothetical protein